MDLFSDLAQMCTKFTQIMRVQNGIKGCLTIEPLLLGVVQSSYNVGCFNMDEPGVQQPTSESTTPRLVFSKKFKFVISSRENEFISMKRK